MEGLPEGALVNADVTGFIKRRIKANPYQWCGEKYGKRGEFLDGGAAERRGGGDGLVGAASSSPLLRVLLLYCCLMWLNGTINFDGDIKYFQYTNNSSRA